MKRIQSPGRTYAHACGSQHAPGGNTPYGRTRRTAHVRDRTLMALAWVLALAVMSWPRACATAGDSERWQVDTLWSSRDVGRSLVAEFRATTRVPGPSMMSVGIADAVRRLASHSVDITMATVADTSIDSIHDISWFECRPCDAWVPARPVSLRPAVSAKYSGATSTGPRGEAERRVGHAQSHDRPR